MADSSPSKVKAQEWIVRFDGKIKRVEKELNIQVDVNRTDSLRKDTK